jgi:hypothetical protein
MDHLVSADAETKTDRDIESCFRNRFAFTSIAVRAALDSGRKFVE